MDNWYSIGAIITGAIAFLAIWFYSFIAWGFLIGLAIGWLPAMIGAVLFGALWPLVVLAIAGFAILIFAG